MKTVFASFLSTPIGELGVFADNDSIFRIEFIDTLSDQDLVNNSYKENKLTQLARAQLEQYFTGERTVFDLPMTPQGTPFRQQTWQALQKIPYGETRYYSQQAELMNNKKAVRAVGAANGANPIAIVIPCHRVIGKNGSLTGYAGGLQKKAWLLNFEQEQLQDRQAFTLN